MASEEEERLFTHACEIVWGNVLPMTMKAAIDLGVFDIICRAGPQARLSPSQIAAQLSTKNPEAPDMLDRILRLLASHSVLTCSVVDRRRLYGLAPVSKYFVPNEDGVSLAAMMASNQDGVFLDSWSQLKNAVLEGGTPFDRAHGCNLFEYLGKDERFNQVFNKAMLNHTTILATSILQAYKGFEQFKEKLVVDVGGGLGIFLSLVTKKYPSIKGVNFDLPHVIQHAKPYPGVKHVGGDMFAGVPNGDAIFMKSILHDWSDEKCLNILKNCYNAIPDDGMVIVMERVIPMMPETNAATRVKFQVDISMMTLCPGGKERTEDEYRALATKTGFRGVRFVCQASLFCIMEFFK